jgi:aminopeptidase-like protein
MSDSDHRFLRHARATTSSGAPPFLSANCQLILDPIDPNSESTPVGATGQPRYPHAVSTRGGDDRLWRLVEDLYPLHRAVTGPGVRATLARVRAEIPIEIHEIPSGTPVLDWTVPDEWSVREAWIKAPDGRRFADIAECNLHLMSYSRPVHCRLGRAELDQHLHSLPDRPSAIPFKASVLGNSWGFCLTHDERASLVDGEYEVLVDATLEPGSLTYGELVIPGSTTDEVLLATHVCHPSMANDNVSGIAVLTELARRLAARRRKFTYRLLFIPGTFGSITWLATHRDVVPRVRHGLVLTGLGDAAPLNYKQSRRGVTDIDRAAAMVFRERDAGDRCIPFSPYGYDERQFCSPGFDLAVGRLSRSLHGEFPEYHTNNDNLSFISDAQLRDSIDAAERILDTLEANRTMMNLAPEGEPQLGKRGLFTTLGGGIDAKSFEIALLWLLSDSDGSKDLVAIAEHCRFPYAQLVHAAEALESAGLLKEIA